MANSVIDTTNDTKRLVEIVKIINRNKPAQDMCPEKLCKILMELGPTFIKLGQLLSMHPEVLPMEYCRELENLRTDADHLVTAQIRDIIDEEYGRPWTSVFQRIMPYPLGAASIAQVHEAVLLDGTKVAIKIQRPEIYDTMERDVRLLKKALGLGVINSKFAGVVELPDIIDEMWLVAQEEMDFEREAENIARLRENIEGIAYVYCPKVYSELSTKRILVMEYIGGCELTDKKTLLEQGYDLSEVCTKFINNYIKQFAEDLFFHADPHPGNVHVENGRIVWLDLGMMGKMPPKSAEMIKLCMRSIVTNDYMTFADSILRLCEHDSNIDLDSYHEAVRVYLDKYRIVSMEEMASTTKIFEDLFHIARDYGIKISRSLTMYWRSISIMEGTVSDLSPETDLTAIIAKHMAAQGMIGGVAGAISKKVSHRKLISGKALSYTGHEQEEDEEPEDIEDIEEENGAD